MSENKSLIVLTQDYQRLMTLLIEAGGEITPEIEQELTINQETLAKKTDGYDFLITKLEAEEEYWKARSDQYTRVARSCANARARLRESIKAAMQIMGATEIVGENATFKLVNGAPKLVLNDKDLPKEFVTETVLVEPNKDLIKATLKSGNTVPGAHFEPVVQLRTSVSRKVK
jgi:hypothetical protein